MKAIEPININDLVGHVISYQWDGKTRQGKVLRIRDKVVVVEDSNKLTKGE